MEFWQLALEITGWLVVSLLLLLASLALAVPFFRGAWFVPIPAAIVGKIIAKAELGPADRVADIGSGDGRLVLAAARAGAQVFGIEINPVLVWWTRLKIKKTGLADQVEIKLGNFWHSDFSSYNVILVYGLDRVMRDLGGKLKKELRPSSRIFSYKFQFPNFLLYKAHGDGIYEYRI